MAMCVKKIKTVLQTVYEIQQNAKHFPSGFLNNFGGVRHTKSISAYTFVFHDKLIALLIEFWIPDKIPPAKRFPGGICF